MKTKNKNSMSKTLPSYRKPPVNEVVSGMRFHPPNKLRIPHIGYLWEKFRKDYPQIQHAPPISSAKGQILVDKTIGIPLPRVWFINKQDDQLIQFQVDRFYFNWRRRESKYPRYEYVIKNFEYVWETVEKFFNEFELGELEPEELELSYINHIPKDQGWDTIDDLPEIFSDFIWEKRTDRFLPNPDKIAWQTEFPVHDNKGHLFVNLKQAIRTEDKVPILVLELKMKGIGEATEKEAIRECFDMAHEWIVRGFTDLTTSKVQKIWEPEDNA